MHYFIDGYNLLFRLMGGEVKKPLKTERQLIIDELEQKFRLLELDATIVFDGTIQLNEISRTHFGYLEICFSSQGETADDYIIQELRNRFHIGQQTVVTSDKKLAWWARHSLAKTESIELFFSRINRCYRKRLKEINQKTLSQPIISYSLPKLLPGPVSTNPASFKKNTPKENPNETDFDRWLRIFEEKKRKFEET